MVNYEQSPESSMPEPQAALSARVFDMMIASSDTRSSSKDQPVSAEKSTSTEPTSAEKPIAQENPPGKEPSENQNKWEKNKPDLVKEEAESPTKADVAESTKKADDLFKDEYTKKVYKALVTGHMAGLDMMLHDLRHDHGLEKGEGKKILQKVVDELNKVLRYPVELVTNNDSGPPPELGLKFAAYHYDGGGKGEFGRGYAEEMSVTIWGHGKYEARTFYTMPRSAANLAADMGEADKRLKTMLVQSVLRSNKD